MRGLIVVATLVLATAGTAGADSGRCAAEQQAVRADSFVIGADMHHVRDVRAQAAVVGAERRPLHYQSQKVETRIVHNQELIDATRNWKTCVPGGRIHCRNMETHFIEATGALARNTALLTDLEGRIAVFDALLVDLAQQESDGLAKVAADRAKRETDRQALEACQAG